ncbi:restriction endonuclease [bacterium]|nr:restriction endonuclease [bacterium]
MANPEHLAVLSQGIEAWNEWRRHNHGLCPDLAGANLRNAILCGIDFSGANLGAADLSGADLRKASFFGADLSGASLRGADLSGAILRSCLRNADLSRDNLNGAVLCGLFGVDAADLTGANLTDAHLTPVGPMQGGCSFLDLATCDGLDSAIFSDPTVLQQYLVEAFEYAHQPSIEEHREFCSHFLKKAIEKIRYLRTIYQGQETPASLVEAIHTITQELVKYLAKHPKALHGIHPRTFEELIAEILTSYGWQVHLTSTTRDGGYDIFATAPVPGHESTSWLIECKRFGPDNKVGVEIVRALYGLKLDLRVANAMLATTSHFSRAAHAYKASRYDLKLRDYEGILEWLNEYRPSPDGKLYIKDNRLLMAHEK